MISRISEHFNKSVPEKVNQCDASQSGPLKMPLRPFLRGLTALFDALAANPSQETVKQLTCYRFLKTTYSGGRQS
jgi:hypothetical protein